MIAMLIGILGITANCVIYQQKNGKNLLLWKLISDILWFFHYLFLGAYSGSAVALIGVFRELVFIKKIKKKEKIFFFNIFLIRNLFIYDNYMERRHKCFSGTCLNNFNYRFLESQSRAFPSACFSCFRPNAYIRFRLCFLCWNCK